MLNPAVNIGDVAHAIQLALAPVFLLTGIAGILNVMAGRLARIIDRGRYLTESPVRPELQAGDALTIEIQTLERRGHLASAAITACTFSALLVCMVIASLFLEVLLQLELRWLLVYSSPGPRWRLSSAWRTFYGRFTSLSNPCVSQCRLTGHRWQRSAA